jgi:CMP-N-acetylneuraminic acid synthetase
VGGVPLVARAVAAARATSAIDLVCVSTDDAAIAAAATAAGAVVIERPTALADDQASSEAALVHAVHTLDGLPEIVVMIQPTSPFLTAVELDDLVAAIDAGADSAFTAAPFHGFLWRQEETATGVNHDHSHRPRRQDREPE